MGVPKQAPKGNLAQRPFMNGQLCLKAGQIGRGSWDERRSNAFDEVVPLVIVLFQVKVLLQEGQHGPHHNLLTFIGIQAPTDFKGEKFADPVTSQKSKVSLTPMNRTKDSYDPGLFMMETYLLHQVNTLCFLELLSIDEEYRASGIWVKVTFQRKHPSIQSHSTAGTGPDICNEIESPWPKPE